MLVAAIAALANAQEETKKCHALVLSGGSNRGAWEAGVIWGLSHYAEDPADFAWDTVSGVSAGSINSGGIATWPTGSEIEMTEWLSDVWAGMSNDQVYYKREGTVEDLLFREPSFLNDDPALATLRSIINDRSVARSFAVSAVDVQTGDYIAMTQDDTPLENLAQSALSSSSIPVTFQPQHLNGHIFMDGGTVWNVNLDTAINQCLEHFVDKQEDIIVDIAICGTLNRPGQPPKRGGAGNWMLGREIKKAYSDTSQIF